MFTVKRSRLFATVELLFATVIQTLQASRFLSASVIYLFVVSWLSLRLRKRGWRQLGLRRPTSWLHAIGVGTAAGVVYQAVSIWLVIPLLYQITNEPLDLSQFTSLHRNVSLLFFWLAISWTIGAFGEEMVYRGYLLNRAADLFGQSQGGLAFGLFISSALFGMGHAYQGINGIVDTFFFGCVMAGLYYFEQRNLWPLIIAHGVYDTVALVLIFLGLYP